MVVWCGFFTDNNTTPTKLFCFVLCCWLGCGNLVVNYETKCTIKQLTNLFPMTCDAYHCILNWKIGGVFRMFVAKTFADC